jgi:uncharacterized protein (DUF1697 family)
VRFVALVRGINVGGANKLPMADLRALVARLGCRDVETVGASGNVVLTASAPAADVNDALEAAISQRLRKPIGVVLRSRPQWARIVEADPFPAKPADDVRLAVTFLRHATDAPLPPVAGIDVVRRTPTELFTVWRLARGRPPAFTRHEKALGVASTTRFWTVVRQLAEVL